MKIEYKQYYVPRVDITIVMKAIYEDDELIDYVLSGYYFGEPERTAFETFKDSLEKKIVIRNGEK